MLGALCTLGEELGAKKTGLLVGSGGFAGPEADEAGAGRFFGAGSGL